MPRLSTSTWVRAAEEPSPLLPHMSELIVGAVAFGLLFFFLRAKVFPMFEKTYADRASTIEGGIKRAEEAQAEAARLLEEYREQLAGARADAAQIRADAQAERQSIVAEARTEAQAAAAAVTERAEAQLSAEAERVRSELSREIGRMATDLAEKIVGETLDEERVGATVDRFISDLETTTAEEQGTR